MEVYCFEETKAREADRKNILMSFFLSNIRAEDPARGAQLQSELRHQICLKILVEQALSSDKQYVFMPALEVMYELLGVSSDSQSERMFLRLKQVIKKSQNLRRFGKAIIDLLVKARNGRIIFAETPPPDFYNKSVEVTKTIAQRPSRLGPELKEYLASQKAIASAQVQNDRLGDLCQIENDLELNGK